MSMMVSLIEFARELKLVSYFFSFLNSKGIPSLTSSGKLLAPNMTGRGWRLIPLLRFLLLILLFLLLLNGLDTSSKTFTK